MVKSMTGFASLTHEDEVATVGVSVRSVNHRFLDLQLRLPAQLGDLESRVRASVGRRLARGRVEVGITLQSRQPTVPSVEINEPFVTALSAALDRARDRGLVSGPLTPGDLLRLPQAVNIRDRAEEHGPELAARYAASVEAALDRALLDLDAMRTREGEHLRSDLAQRIRRLAALMQQLTTAAAAGGEALQGRVAERVRELTAVLPVDQGLVAQEIVRMVGRSDISEEITRFGAHLAHWDALTSADEPCGRKLDFLLQEMNREVNTVGSKADGVGVSELVIELKAELERMREQVQNVE